jgi:hypothetical protein
MHPLRREKNVDDQTKIKPDPQVPDPIASAKILLTLRRNQRRIVIKYLNAGIDFETAMAKMRENWHVRRG